MNTTPSDSTGLGMHFPILVVPTFDGNILHWRQFWEQFCVSIHNRPNLSNVEKDQSVTPIPNELEVLANMAAATFKTCSLLMTCQVLIIAPNDLSVRVRALLDSGSSASLISERIVQSPRLSCTKQKVSVSGIGGISHDT